MSREGGPGPTSEVEAGPDFTRPGHLLPMSPHPSPALRRHQNLPASHIRIEDSRAPSKPCVAWTMQGAHGD